jgi:8-oxo-dGTP pyrophosphatase MutT (NUDIX family)
MKIEIDDPRLLAPQCPSLTPVEIVHENKWFSLYNRGGYYTLEYKNPQVVVLPIVEGNAIVMVRVKRPVIADFTLELPAGDAIDGELPLQAAERELKEEAGIGIDDLKRFTLLPSVVISPNRYPILPHIYEVKISQQEFDVRAPHDDEVTQVECLSFKEVIEMMANGMIYVGLPMAVIAGFLSRRSLSKERMI